MFSRGFTLLETIIALFILTTGVMGISLAFFYITSIFPTVSLRLTATYLAQEGIEIIRNLRDTNWLKEKDFAEGLLICSAGCEADYKTGTPEQDTPLRFYKGSFLNLDENNFYSYSFGRATPYKRKIMVEKIEDDILKVTVWVYWSQKGKLSKIEVQEYLYDWFEK